ncbi:NADPH-dependent 2,4-dienoyl-CoA reductase, sulfur reductase [Psychrobacillus sp. OK028]|uniref:FAD-dependent oxidoreductase n=1 Tax=Psychrobacillus sp. OK028 TaxID=1884359 RepID=UPI00088DE8CB|nr:FAD-dependent oxidoreductase [Psychrobacillus sp. OK028]SDN46529.1 NADPH-dependent 2,4-dienoyl-CoA reductase, sulfur reductase [Psychrobacillus sp. OK028]
MHYVIIGGDAAGMSAAMEIVRNDSGARITTLEKGHIYSYGQCGLPYVVGKQVASSTDVIARSVEMFRSKYGIDAKTGYEVTQVDPKNKTVSGDILQTRDKFILNYDRLLIATGATPVIPEWDGSHLLGIHTIKTIPNTEAIIADLENVQQVTIIGGGYIGLEMAENFESIGKKVRIIQRANQLAGIFDEDVACLIHEHAKAKGVEVILNEEVQSFSGDTRVRKVITDKGSYPTDLVLVAVGVKPTTDFLEGTGIQMHLNGAIIVNEYLETNVENIYAAGDCATHFHRIKQLNDYIPLGTTANKQGRLAGLNMIGQTYEFKGIVGTSIMKFFDLVLAKTGLSEKETEQLGISYDIHVQEATDIAGYYPGKETMHMKLIYRKDDQLLLGGQIIGGNGVDKRIDVLATALFHRMTFSELLDLDLAYAPPFNGVWDPLQQMAKRNTTKK